MFLFNENLDQARIGRAFFDMPYCFPARFILLHLKNHNWAQYVQGKNCGKKDGSNFTQKLAKLAQKRMAI